MLELEGSFAIPLSVNQGRHLPFSMVEGTGVFDMDVTMSTTHAHSGLHLLPASVYGWYLK